MMNTMNSKIPNTNPYSDGDAPFFSAYRKKKKIINYQKMARQLNK